MRLMIVVEVDDSANNDEHNENYDNDSNIKVDNGDGDIEAMKD